MKNISTLILLYIKSRKYDFTFLAIHEHIKRHGYENISYTDVRRKVYSLCSTGHLRRVAKGVYTKSYQPTTTQVYEYLMDNNISGFNHRDGLTDRLVDYIIKKKFDKANENLRWYGGINK